MTRATSSKYFLHLTTAPCPQPPAASLAAAAAAGSASHRPAPADVFLTHSRHDDTVGYLPDNELDALVQPLGRRRVDAPDRRFLQSMPQLNSFAAAAQPNRPQQAHAASRKRSHPLQLQGEETAVRPKLAAALPITDIGGAYSTADEEFLTELRELDASFRGRPPPAAARLARREPPAPSVPIARTITTPPAAPAPAAAAKPSAAPIPLLTPIDYSAPPVLQAISESIGIPIKFKPRNNSNTSKEATEESKQPVEAPPAERQEPPAKRQKAQQNQPTSSAAVSDAIDLTDAAAEESQELEEGGASERAFINDLAAPVSDREAEIFLRSKRQVLSRLSKRKQQVHLRKEAERTTRIHAKQPMRKFLQPVDDDHRYEAPDDLPPLTQKSSAASARPPRKEVITLSATPSSEDDFSLSETTTAATSSPRWKRSRKSAKCVDEPQGEETEDDSALTDASPPPRAKRSKKSTRSISEASPEEPAAPKALPGWQSRSRARKSVPAAASTKPAMMKQTASRAASPEVTQRSTSKKKKSTAKVSAAPAKKPAPVKKPKQKSTSKAKSKCTAKRTAQPSHVLVSTFGGAKRAIQPPVMSLSPETELEEEVEDESEHEEQEEEVDPLAGTRKRKRIEVVSDEEETDSDELEDLHPSKRSTASASTSSAASSHHKSTGGSGYFAWHSGDPSRPPPSNIGVLARRASGKTRGAKKLRERMEQGEMEQEWEGSRKNRKGSVCT